LLDFVQHVEQIKLIACVSTSDFYLAAAMAWFARRILAWRLMARDSEGCVTLHLSPARVKFCTSANARK
jgi:hypothetical protein